MIYLNKRGHLLTGKHIRPPAKAAKAILFILFCPVFLSCTATLVMNHGDFSRMNVFGFRPCIALSGSMDPTIQTDALCLTDMRPQEYKTGDIILFRHHYGNTGQSALICHRIVRMTSAGDFITKGDNNERADPWRTASKDILGKVVWIGNFFAGI